MKKIYVTPQTERLTAHLDAKLCGGSGNGFSSNIGNKSFEENELGLADDKLYHEHNAGGYVGGDDGFISSAKKVGFWDDADW